MRKTCTRCRQPRAGVRPYEVRSHEGDRFPVRTALCRPCLLAVLRGRAKVTAIVHALTNDARAIACYEDR